MSKRVVPHQRTGKPGKRQRGVWFTYDDILQIGRMLPDVLSGRQANSRAESTPVDEPTEPAHHYIALEVTADAVTEDFSHDDFAQYIGLASVRRVAKSNERAD